MEIVQIVRKGDLIRWTSWGGHPVKQVELQEVRVPIQAPVYEIGNPGIKGVANESL